MNFLAAFLLLAGVAEEDAFWCLVVLVEDVVPGYFCEGMVAAKVCVCVCVCVFACGALWLFLLPRLCVHACLLARPHHLGVLRSPLREEPEEEPVAHAERAPRPPTAAPLSPHVPRSAVMPALWWRCVVYPSSIIVEVK